MDSAFCELCDQGLPVLTTPKKVKLPKEPNRKITNNATDSVAHET